MSTITTPSTFNTSDTRLASTLAYLGYPVEFKPTVHEATRQKHVQFFFDQTSIRFTTLPTLHELLTQYRSDQITDVHHLINVCDRSHQRYDAILRWQKDHTQQRLHLHESAKAYTYKAGIPPPTSGALEYIDHLQLAAALGEIGFQIHDIRGPDRAREYALPFIGLPIIDSHGETFCYRLLEVTRLSPTKEDPRRLALEVEQPMHPLVISYNLLRCRALLKKQIEAAQANLLIEDGPRQALIALNPKGHVMDHVTAHFKAPPLP
ncbi:hypothetical protein [Prosthecobacter sp.]|uniref:hypothetical protein n=1 Tax=Prosthecobacter sp. TaxID=1965333 RepID=UPI0037850D99